jgi:hypothetical protein
MSGLNVRFASIGAHGRRSFLTGCKVKFSLITISVLSIFLALAPSSFSADGNWCGTQRLFDLKPISKPVEPNACPQYGA